MRAFAPCFFVAVTTNDLLSKSPLFIPRLGAKTAPNFRGIKRALKGKGIDRANHLQRAMWPLNVAAPLADKSAKDDTTPKTTNARSEMKRAYMKGIEFKERQLWLDFECAASIALRVVADSIDDFRKWFKAWKAKPKTKEVNFSGFLFSEAAALVRRAS